MYRYMHVYIDGARTSWKHDGVSASRLMRTSSPVDLRERALGLSLSMMVSTRAISVFSILKISCDNFVMSGRQGENGKGVKLRTSSIRG